MNNEYVITVKNLTKHFPRHPQAMRKQEEIGSFMFYKLFRSKKLEPFIALDNITLSVKKGEAVGLVGSNGAGKSTLLRVITGISAPTAGKVNVIGQYRELFALNAGFNMDLSGRKNIYLYAAMKDISKDEIENRMDEIIEFSGLGDFIDEPVKNYSSGMRGRLGFSLISHTAPDILFIDEALSTGDAAFRKKCDETLIRFREEQKTLMIVSHGVGVLEKLCTSIIWLEHGKIKMAGPVGDVLGEYKEFQQQRAQMKRQRLTAAP